MVRIPVRLKFFEWTVQRRFPNFVFILVILLMAVVFPLMIFLNLLSARQAGGETVGQLLELAGYSCLERLRYTGTGVGNVSC